MMLEQQHGQYLGLSCHQTILLDCVGPFHSLGKLETSLHAHLRQRFPGARQGKASTTAETSADAGNSAGMLRKACAIAVP